MHSRKMIDKHIKAGKCSAALAAKRAAVEEQKEQRSRKTEATTKRSPVSSEFQSAIQSQTPVTKRGTYQTNLFSLKEVCCSGLRPSDWLKTWA